MVPDKHGTKNLHVLIRPWYFREIYPSESKNALLKLTVTATGSSKTSVRILKEIHGLKSKEPADS